MYNKKILCIVFCMLLFFNIISYIVSSELPIIIPDQKQKIPGDSGWLVNNNFEVAQSFVPSKNVLSQVNLYLRVMGEVDWSITFSIREELTGGDLVTIDKDAYMYLVDPHYAWIVFDFPDINVVRGETYYIILASEYGDEIDSYGWIRNEDDVYPKGETYGAEKGTNNWEIREGDCCFVTYAPLVKQKRLNSIKNQIFWLFERFSYLQSYFSNFYD